MINHMVRDGVYPNCHRTLLVLFFLYFLLVMFLDGLAYDSFDREART